MLGTRPSLVTWTQSGNCTMSGSTILEKKNWPRKWIDNYELCSGLVIIWLQLHTKLSTSQKLMMRTYFYIAKSSYWKTSVRTSKKKKWTPWGEISSFQERPLADVTFEKIELVIKWFCWQCRKWSNNCILFKWFY